MDPAKKRRITVKFKSANPLFEKWITQWKEEAKKEGSNRERAFCRALASLKKCPIPLNSGKDCKILKGFGDRLCQMLDNKLKGDVIVIDDEINDSEPVLDNSPCTSSENLHIESEIKKNTIPKQTLSVKVKTNRKQLSDEAAKSQQKLILNNVPTSSETITIDSEAEKEYVAEGTSAVQTKTVKKQLSSGSVGSSQTQCKEEFLYFSPGSFDIVLYIDTAETSGGNVKVKNDPLLAEITKLADVLAYEVQRLNVGDFVWICRHKINKKELILPYIIERKRLDDFAQSIKDGRYHEQKFRLGRSGIQNKTYLVENYSGKYMGLPLQTLIQAATNTAVQEGYNVKITSNLRNTAQYLSIFTKKLIKEFKDKAVMSCPKDSLEENQVTDDLYSLMTFKEFNESSLKNKTMMVTELFVKTLVQLKGMTVEKALAVVEVYPFPALLLKAYTEDPEGKPENLLSQIQFGKYKKKLGPALSKIVYELFTFER